MADAEPPRVIITKPGTLVFGTSLPAGTDIHFLCQDETITQVACGRNHSAIVCASGRVYTFNNDCKLSLVTTLESCRVTQVACGYCFTIYLTDEGDVYSCGLNDVGQLGFDHTDKVTTPTLVTRLPPVKKVAAGFNFTVVLTVRGEVWVCGCNSDGELGLGHTNIQSSFTHIPNLPQLIRPIDISCGSHHTALLTTSPVLVMAGINNNGQLGLDTTKTQTSFAPILRPSSGVSAVSCGSYHTVTLREDGSVWAWGTNDSGQLGTGDRDKRTAPTRMIGLENHIITEVIAGCDHTALMTEEGDVLVCGSGKDGELGIGEEDILVATLLPKSPGLVVKQVAFANEYSVMLVETKVDTTPTSQLECKGTLQSDQTRAPITDWERSFMRSLECPVCFKIMIAPIHQCATGHSLCDACRSHTNITVCPLCREVFGTIRNLASESLSAEIQLPCVECLERMPTKELDLHAEVCPKRKYSCPLQQSCGWRGQPDAMLDHSSSEHPDQTWRDLPHLFLHSTSDDLVHTDVLAAHNQVFTLHRRYNKTSGEFQAVVRYIGSSESRDTFMFEFKFMNNNVERIFRNILCSDICSVGDSFQSTNCVILKREFVDTFLQQGRLVCQVAILTVKTNDLADRINALLIA